MRFDRLVFVSGQGATDPHTGQLAGKDVATQTAQCLANVEAILKAAGSSLQCVLRCGVFLVDMAEFARMNEAYERTFGGHRPARTTIQAAALPGKGLRVEIDAVAYVLEIWTDGTVSPEKGLSTSAKLVIDHVRLIAGINEEMLTIVTDREIGGSRLPSELAETPVEALDLSVRVFNSLKRQASPPSVTSCTCWKRASRRSCPSAISVKRAWMSCARRCRRRAS